ncbi:hypothetical protein BGZ61DRAFT_477811 [Ilyonectria robusta]|uniref:uncharacterized protein n=1 Tax=Ilyonectria robusta TaxID=1079257 RepID=UPI001E8CFC04|nr:uncharacterized protein BGZ61DRAFT_477811 [Ilyonectria robusta]KAH8699850.1 hypothetical protein BGZ61DRAFT_477811 [Ilyonectria robusta]
MQSGSQPALPCKRPAAHATANSPLGCSSPPPRERIEQRDPAPVELGRQPRREVTANGGLPNRALIVQVLDVCVALGRPRGQRSASTARPATSTPVCETPACTPRPVVMCPGACWEMIITWTLLKVVRWLFSGAFGGRLPASLPGAALLLGHHYGVLYRLKQVTVAIAAPFPDCWGTGFHLVAFIPSCGSRSACACECLAV